MRIDSATGANSSLTGSFLSQNGVLSSSAQIASEISGSSTSLSSSIASRVTTEENNVDVLQSHQGNIHAFTSSADGEITALMDFTGSAARRSAISGSITTFSSSIATRVTTEENNVDVLQAHQGNIHAFTASADGEITALMGATSSYAAKTAISGAFTSTSASIASDIASNVSNISSIGSFTASLDSDITTFSLPSSTTISTFGKSLVDDADASAARTTLGLGTAATTAATDYATAAQGTTADNALPKAGGQMTGNITFSGAQTVDGRDLSADGSKLDNIEENADVTDTANVTAAGALMDSEVDADIKTLSLPANTTISAFGKTLVDDADASAARTTLGVDAAGTDNSTDVTLAGTPNYITISGQVITRNTIDIGDDTNLAVSDTTGQTGIDLTLSGDTLSGVVSGLGTGASPTFSGLTVSNDVTINGDLTVLGDATELQVSSLNVEDINITIASGAADSSAANGAGITIAGANESLTWDHGNSRFTFSDDLNVGGNITLTGTVDGRDIASDGGKLDGIEAGADVTDTANVTAAGALMDSEVDADIKTLSLPASTTISTFGASLVDDADAATARTTLDVDQAGTDNSTDVTLVTTSHDYLSLAGQAITLGTVDISDDTNLVASTGITLTGDTLTTNDGQIVHDNLSGFVADEHIAHSGVTLTAGNGLTGGGTIAASRTFAVGAGTLIDVTADAVNVDLSELSTSTTNGDGDYFVVVDTLNAQRKLTKANINISGFNNDSGFTTNVGDITGVTAGNGLTGGGSSGTVTVNVAAGTGISVAADSVSTNDSQIVHDNLSGFVANEHIDHSTVSITAGNGLTGGGTIAATRTLNIGAGTGITVAADAISIGQDVATSADVQFDSLGIGTAASGITGEIRATGDITAFYSSDERLKENFAPLTGALDKVKAIGGYEFDWKEGIEEVVSKTGHDIGVKAQELQAQYPELVHERDNGYLAVDYVKLNAVLIEAVKELSAKVDELSKKFVN